MCLKEIATGDELYHVGGNKFVCKEDYDLQQHDIESRLKYFNILFFNLCV